MAKNRLTKLPKNFFNGDVMQYLAALSVEDNELRWIPKGFEEHDYFGDCPFKRCLRVNKNAMASGVCPKPESKRVYLYDVTFCVEATQQGHDGDEF